MTTQCLLKFSNVLGKIKSKINDTSPSYADMMSLVDDTAFIDDIITLSTCKWYSNTKNDIFIRIYQPLCTPRPPQTKKPENIPTRGISGANQPPFPPKLNNFFPTPPPKSNDPIYKRQHHFVAKQKSCSLEKLECISTSDFAPIENVIETALNIIRQTHNVSGNGATINTQEILQVLFTENQETSYKLFRIIEDFIHEIQLLMNMKLNTATINARRNVTKVNVSDRLMTEFTASNLQSLLNYHGRDEAYRQALASYLYNTHNIKLPLFDSMQSMIEKYRDMPKYDDETFNIFRKILEIKFTQIANDFSQLYRGMTTSEAGRPRSNPILQRVGLTQLFQNFNPNEETLKKFHNLAELLCAVKHVGIANITNNGESLRFYIQENYIALIEWVKKNQCMFSRSLSNVVLLRNQNYTIGSTTESHVYDFTKKERLPYAYSAHTHIYKDQSNFLIPLFSIRSEIEEYVKISVDEEGAITLTPCIKELPDTLLLLYKKALVHEWWKIQGKIILGHGDMISILYVSDNNVQHQINYRLLGTPSSVVNLKEFDNPVMMKDFVPLLDITNLDTNLRKTITNMQAGVTVGGKSAKLRKKHGKPEKIAYKGKSYVLKTGKRGGSYIEVDNKKVYVKAVSKTAKNAQ